ncbi:MAG: CbtB domain-containing protein [Nitrosopumilaceae archaeon]
MSKLRSITISKSEIPLYAIILLAGIFAIGLFIVGYDQGHIFSIVLGEDAYAEQFIHELTHDMRHAAGFPCH